MYRKLAIHLINELEKEQKDVLASINEFIRKSRYNISQNGFLGALQGLNLIPKIYVSQAAHYSIKKVANVLGYGEHNIKSIPVESNFRLNIDALKNELFNINENEYVGCVIGILGTTEEGAIDPIHHIKYLRDELETLHNRSFWLHVDAAWGGYIKSLFCHPELIKPEKNDNMDKVCERYKQKLEANEVFDIMLKDKILERKVKVEWKDSEVYKAILTLQEADSTTVDPHKLGYVPYPAGVISFKNGVVTEHIVQEAQYISEEKGGIKNIHELVDINAVGPYILEGSKPGAAAAATWLAHKIIKLDAQGHGKIIRTTILNTQKLVRYIDYHVSMFIHIDELLHGENNLPAKPFSFKYLYAPDSNVVCFIAVPMKYDGNKLDQSDTNLSELNIINTNLYKHLSIHDASTPYSQEFFVSKTEFKDTQYSFISIKPLLDRLKIKEDDYRQNGLFALRCTLMNPWHWEAQRSGMDYLMEFVIHLHKLTREILN
jgi:glutamate/tyrosine decarboxylase-like PLP-dependent enzyme